MLLYQYYTLSLEWAGFFLYWIDRKLIYEYTTVCIFLFLYFVCVIFCYASNYVCVLVIFSSNSCLPHGKLT